MTRITHTVLKFARKSRRKIAWHLSPTYRELKQTQIAEVLRPLDSWKEALFDKVEAAVSLIEQRHGRKPACYRRFVDFLNDRDYRQKLPVQVCVQLESDADFWLSVADLQTPHKRFLQEGRVR